VYDDDGKPIGDGQHWVRTDGPRLAITPEQEQQARALVRQLAAGVLEVGQALEQMPGRRPP